MLRLLPILALIVFAFAAATPSRSARAAGTNCDALALSIKTDRQAKDYAPLPALLSRARDLNSGCPEKTVLCLGRSVALAYVEKAYALADAGKTVADLETVLAQAKEFSSPWALSALEGDLEYDRATSGEKDGYLRAALDYEVALNDLHEPRICENIDEPPAPTTAQIARIVKRASEAKMLAGSFQLVRTRDGECGGVFLKQIRDFVPKSTPLPVEFEYNSSDFTEKGKEAMQALLECTKQENFSRIKLTGHTDMKGDDAYNMALSERRLEAVRDFLAHEGYHGRIEIVPMGKRQPFELDDAGQHSQAEIDQLNRRVELREASK